jgi:hypothetical protein
MGSGTLTCTGTTVIPKDSTDPGSQTGGSGPKPPSVSDEVNKKIIDEYKKGKYIQ